MFSQLNDSKNRKEVEKVMSKSIQLLESILAGYFRGNKLLTLFLETRGTIE